MDAVMCASSLIRGRWDLLQMRPHRPRPPIHPSLLLPGHHPCLQMNGGPLRYRLCHHRRGRTKSSSFLCPFKNLKARLFYLMILYDFFPPFFHFFKDLGVGYPLFFSLSFLILGRPTAWQPTQKILEASPNCKEWKQKQKKSVGN